MGVTVAASSASGYKKVGRQFAAGAFLFFCSMWAVLVVKTSRHLSLCLSAKGSTFTQTLQEDVQRLILILRYNSSAARHIDLGVTVLEVDRCVTARRGRWPAARWPASLLLLLGVSSQIAFSPVVYGRDRS